MIACEQQVTDVEPGQTTVFNKAHHASAWLPEQCVVCEDPLEFDFSTENCVGEFDFHRGQFVTEISDEDGKRRFVFSGRVGLPKYFELEGESLQTEQIVLVYFCLGFAKNPGEGENFFVPRKP